MAEPLADIVVNNTPPACSLVVPYPRFLLPPEVTYLSAGEFQSMVRSPAQAPGPRVAWLVMFYADWCGASHVLKPMFGALARRCVMLWNVDAGFSCKV